MSVVLANVVLLMTRVPMAIANTSVALRLIIIFLVTIGFNPFMEIEYMPCELKALNGHLRLDSVTYGKCRSLGILRRPRYLHRSSRRFFSIYQPSPSVIPSVWSSNRALSKKKHPLAELSNCRTVEHRDHLSA
ncbi:hypothetical protein QQF64_026268 [Cirrhinus molitorella]|uniref:Secreted protein n=1 Tax=Cirrhinus molitorella TaxID=172907 RepID=A0ABR3NSR0_9TELE